MTSPGRYDGKPGLADWHIWRGVTGIYYARLPGSSPPRVMRDWDRQHLEDRIRNGEPPPWRLPQLTRT